MIICLEKNQLFGLPCVSCVNLYQFSVFASFPFGSEGGMWDLIVLVPDHCQSFYFSGINDLGQIRKAAVK